MLYVAQQIALTTRCSTLRLCPLLRLPTYTLTCPRYLSSPPGAKTKTNVKARVLNAKFNTDDPRMPVKERLKNMVALYGPTAVILHIGLSLTFLGVTYLVVRYGFDVPAYMQKHNLLNEKYMMIIANGGTFALAYALYKAQMPIRIVVTFTLVPIVARRLQAFGIIKRRVWQAEKP